MASPNCVAPSTSREPDRYPADLGLRSHAAPQIARRVPRYSRLERPCGLHHSRAELFDLGRVPESHRERLQEGLDYKSSWSHQELEEMQREQTDIYAQQLVAEPVIQNR
jgi:hypothetical protein